MPSFADPGELERLGRRAHHLERRRRQRQDLLVAVEPIHDAKALVEVVEHRHAAAAFPDVLEIGSDLHQFLEEVGRVDVGEDVDFAHDGCLFRVWKHGVGRVGCRRKPVLC